MRIAQGGHFLSDVVFAGWTVWLVAQGMRFGWLHWRLAKLKAYRNASNHSA
jgi:membrane-associated PAP2 superfamily phosphatase